MFVRHQVSLSGPETVDSKHLAESVSVKKYHSGNCVFLSANFEIALEHDGLLITKSGVGAKHQNAVTERTIGTVQNMARAMLLHLHTHWPDKLILLYGLLLLIMPCGSTITPQCQIVQTRAQMNCSPVPRLVAPCCNKHEYLDVLVMFSMQNSKMARRFPSGALEHKQACSLGFPMSIRHWLAWSPTFRLDKSLHNFMWYAMRSLRP